MQSFFNTYLVVTILDDELSFVGSYSDTDDYRPSSYHDGFDSDPETNSYSSIPNNIGLIML